MAHGKAKAHSSDSTQDTSGNGAHTKPGQAAGSNGIHEGNGVVADDALQDQVTEEQVAAEAAASVDESDFVAAPEVAAPSAGHRGEVPVVEQPDIDPAETEEWLESLRYVL